MGATLLETTDNIPSIVTAAANGTVFCVEAGTHTPATPINMKQGQSLIGQYGAVLDCTATDQGFDAGSNSCVRGWGCSSACSNVTVRNLVIDGPAEYNCIGIFGSDQAVDDWVIEYNELRNCGFGVNVGQNDDTTVCHNYIHDNDQGNPAATGGYGANETTDLVFCENFFANNGHTQKVSITDGTVFSQNRFLNDVIWYDGDNVNGIIESNYMFGCSGESDIAIHFEISALSIIRNNTVVECPGTAIFISTSRDVEIHGNSLVANDRGLNLFVNCNAVFAAGQPDPTNIGWDLRNVNARDNRVLLQSNNTRVAELTSVNCDAMEVEPYLDGTKNIDFLRNIYSVPNLTGDWFEWGSDVSSYEEWQGFGNDTAGTQRLNTRYTGF